MAVAHLVPVEVIKGPVSTVRMWTSIAVMRIEAVINVAVEVARTVEPMPQTTPRLTASKSAV